MLKRFWLLPLLIGGFAHGAVNEVGTRFSAAESTLDDETIDAAGTVPAGTDLLLCAAISQGSAGADIDEFDWNDGETMTEIVDFDPSASAEVALSVFALVSPTAATSNVTVGTQASITDFLAVSCLMFDGVNDSSVLDATDADAVVNEGTGSGVTVVLPAFGAAGNALAVFAAKIGADSSPGATNSNADYTEVFDFDTGGGQNNNADAGFWAGLIEELTGAEGGTVTFLGGNDPVAGVQVEINIEAVASDSAAVQRRRQMQ